MMRALVAREAAWSTSSRGIATALWTHVVWLALFVGIWGRGAGLPLLSGTLYEQTLAVQWMLLAFLLPWVAARTIAIERGDAIVWTSSLVGLPPSRILVARIVTQSAALALVVAAGFPLIVIAQRMSDTSSARQLVDQTVVLACGFVVATLVTALQMVLASRVAVWLVATLATVALVWTFETREVSMPLLAFVLAMAGLAGAVLVAVRGDSRLRYLSEEPA
jgi:hypothetical protein